MQLREISRAFISLRMRISFVVFFSVFFLFCFVLFFCLFGFFFVFSFIHHKFLHFSLGMFLLSWILWSFNICYLFLFFMISVIFNFVYYSTVYVFFCLIASLSVNVFCRLSSFHSVLSSEIHRMVTKSLTRFYFISILFLVLSQNLISLHVL